MSAPHEEYLRRNLLVCSAIGAGAAVNCAIKRAESLSRKPKWLLEYLASAKERIDKLPHDLAHWRDAAPDSPYIVPDQGRGE